MTWLAYGILLSLIAFAMYLLNWSRWLWRDTAFVLVESCAFVCMVTAGMQTVDREPLIVHGVPSAADSGPSIVSSSSLTVDGQAFIGSSIKSVYHRQGCRYAAMMEHVRLYDSHEEAEADGKHPCKVCLPGIELARGQ